MHGSPARLDSPWMEWKISFNRIDEVDGGFDQRGGLQRVLRQDRA